jgi:hypothetical protein
MRRYIILIIVSLSCLYCFSQQDNSITIGIIVPEQLDEVNADAFRLLETKLKSVTAANGISSDLFGTFVMYPTVNIIDKKLVEGGMKNMYLIEIEMSLFVKQLNNNIEFGSCAKTLKGNGRNLSEAVKNAFTNIKPNDNTYTHFFAEIKKKIEVYYTTNKENMLKSAKTMASLQQYDQAMALLMTYPQSLNGADDILKTAVEIYKQYQNAVCSSIIAKAKGAISMQDYETTISLLETIDSESICQSEALKLIEQINKEIKAEQKKEFDLMNKVIDNEIALENKRIDNEMTLESKRIDAIRDIGVEYAKNHQPRITYTQIIR